MSELGLVMIVKDEEPRIARCLQAVEPFIDHWTICDTGSTDRTKEIVRETLGHIPGRLYEHQWRNFGDNLNMALARAKGTSRWVLRLDADMTFWCDVQFNLRKWMRRRRKAQVDALYVELREGTDRWDLPLITRGDLDWRYVGPTHEYLDMTGRSWLKLNGIQIEHHADGTRRAEKFMDDIRLLAPGVAAGDERAVYYTADSLRCLGRTEEAIEMFLRRSRMGGFEEEAWYAQFMAAKLLGSIPALYAAWRRRPWRHEPLTEAARLAATIEPDEPDVLWRQEVP